MIVQIGTTNEGAYIEARGETVAECLNAYAEAEQLAEQVTLWLLDPNAPAKQVAPTGRRP